ncbi:MAG: DNA polymerase III subunit gamma/tau [Patescibacteria group bacterium]
MPALYRTHRPQTWEALVGQTTIVRTLQQEIRTGRIAHAYLFSGPRGVGKTTAARLLAKTINCIGRAADAAEPDTTCDICRAIQENHAIDLIELDAATHTGIDMVREHIIENAAARPMQLKYKVFIIDEVHRLSPQSFDALLKTLEEPPAHVVFILATTELHKVPATIVSRCQRFTFTHIAPEIMQARLLDLCAKEDATVAPDVLAAIIARSEGCMRDAESLLDQLLSLGKQISAEEAALILPPSVTHDAYPLVLQTLRGERADALALVQDLAARGISFEAVTKAMIDILRATLVHTCAPALTFPYLEGFELHRAELTEAGTPHGTAGLTRILQTFLDAMPLFKQTTVPQLPLELAIVAMTHREEPASTTRHPEPPAPPISHPERSPAKQDGVEGPNQTKKTESVNIKQLSADAAAEILNRLTAEFQETNASLAIMLKNAAALPSDGPRFVVEVPYSLYRDQLMLNGTKHLIETKLRGITDTPWQLECRVREAAHASELAQEVAAAFEGEIL